MSLEWPKEWEQKLAASGQLALERQQYCDELIRLGQGADAAAAAASSYVPDPKMLGQAAFIAEQQLAIRSLLKQR